MGDDDGVFDGVGVDDGVTDDVRDSDGDALDESESVAVAAAATLTRGDTVADAPAVSDGCAGTLSLGASRPVAVADPSTLWLPTGLTVTVADCAARAVAEPSRVAAPLLSSRALGDTDAESQALAVAERDAVAVRDTLADRDVVCDDVGDRVALHERVAEADEDTDRDGSGEADCRKVLVLDTALRNVGRTDLDIDGDGEALALARGDREADGDVEDDVDASADALGEAVTLSRNVDVALTASRVEADGLTLPLRDTGVAEPVADAAVDEDTDAVASAVADASDVDVTDAHDVERSVLLCCAVAPGVVLVVPVCVVATDTVGVVCVVADSESPRLRVSAVDAVARGLRDALDDAQSELVDVMRADSRADGLAEDETDGEGDSRAEALADGVRATDGDARALVDGGAERAPLADGEADAVCAGELLELPLATAVGDTEGDVRGELEGVRDDEALGETEAAAVDRAEALAEPVSAAELDGTVVALADCEGVAAATLTVTLTLRAVEGDVEAEVLGDADADVAALGLRVARGDGVSARGDAVGGTVAGPDGVTARESEEDALVLCERSGDRVAADVGEWTGAERDGDKLTLGEPEARALEGGERDALGVGDVLREMTGEEECDDVADSDTLASADGDDDGCPVDDPVTALDTLDDADAVKDASAVTLGSKLLEDDGAADIVVVVSAERDGDGAVDCEFVAEAQADADASAEAERERSGLVLGDAVGDEARDT